MGAFIQELFRFNLYKRSQGRVARQTTFAALAVIVALGCWCLSDYYGGRGAAVWYAYAVPLVVLIGGLWACFRVVQMPSFADFLIAVEGEMNKVSWPSRGELFRASIVVMIVIFLLAGLLFVFDFVWSFLLGGLLG